MSRYETGVSAEVRAERYLAELGYVPLERRWRGAGGEIDLILRDGETLVFVEVKARPNAPAGSGLLAVTPEKRRRLRSAAQLYLLRAGSPDVPLRFDVVEITRAGIRHVINAF